jgi:ribonuclease HI
MVGSLSDHVHIYVDASLEDSGYSGLGGALFDSSGRILAFFSEELDKEFLELAKEENQSNVLQEMEMLALLISIEIWCPVWQGHKVVAFTDSEAVRCSFLKTWSHKNPCSKLFARIFFVEESNLCPVWLKRVPSQSNPVDILSRRRMASWMGIQNTSVDFRKFWKHGVHSLG